MRTVFLLVNTLALVACGQAPDPANDKSPGVAPLESRPEPVVVYVDQPGEATLRPIFEQFTNETGIPVTIREADRQKNLDDVMSNRGAPPADVLITDNVGDIFKAGDDGALRQLGPESGIDTIHHDFFRDPDKQWFVIAVNTFSIVGADDAVIPGSAEELGDPSLEGQLCLPSSESPDTQALIAGLISEHGERPAERIVRKWIRNLALPPMGSGAQLLDAITDGRCKLAIVTRRDLGLFGTGALPQDPVPTIYSNVFGIGLARHARYPDTAVALLEWLSAGNRGFGDAAFVSSVPEVNPRFPASEVGWRVGEARLLAERAQWR